LIGHIPQNRFFHLGNSNAGKGDVTVGFEICVLSAECGSESVRRIMFQRVRNETVGCRFWVENSKDFF
jgi:hypothetical protein